MDLVAAALLVLLGAVLVLAYLTARRQLPQSSDQGRPGVPASATAEGDQALREEARVLVERENARRARSGGPPLDVEREITRRLGELGS